MIRNPIIEEIREIRHQLGAQFDNDVYRIGSEIRRGQAASGHRVVRPKAAAGGVKHDEPIDAPDRNGRSGFSVKSTSLAPFPAGDLIRYLHRESANHQSVFVSPSN